MRFNALLPAVAALCLAPALASADSMTDTWVGAAKTAVEHRLQSAGVQPGSRDIELKVRVDSDGKLYSPHVVGTSGSRDLDDEIAAAVRKTRLDAPPALLSGRELTFHIGVSDSQVAAINAGGHSATN